ncbi:hypothetical protein [Heyndrickxia camelliae]|uniref:Uncharacterized protein n=1 Tax=Heyndrickxia camelliae TaxID=1707093 RepID=A0A2N3LED0_9BACI|nr:hypothetical protein [Heyndrickxia camelliae]PKR82894.1 hypothetical protein CWO92_22145 [Heyndrickxia camelliae]
MPTEIKYYMVRMVDLAAEKFFEKEMSQFEVESIELKNKMGNNRIQIINKSYSYTKNLVTGRKYAAITF